MSGGTSTSFFLLATGYAVLMIPVWLAIVEGRIGARANLDPSSFHAHELVFGFAVAAGFLLTAVANWMKQETVVGP